MRPLSQLLITLEHDTEKGTYTTQGFVQVDSDTYALAYMGPGDDGFLSTFTISSDGTTITEVDNVHHETDTMALGFSLVQVDSDTYALAYGGTNSQAQAGRDGFISTFDIDSDGIITPIRIENHAAFESASVNFEFDLIQAHHNSLVQVDSDTYAVAYAGKDSDGFITTLTISSDGSTISKVETIEHDLVNGQDNSLVHVNDDTYALAYEGELGDGYISTFTIDSDGDITPIRIQNHAAFESASANTEHDALNGNHNSLVQVDSDTIALAYGNYHVTVSAGLISTFTINSAGAITPIRIQNHAAFESASANLQHDTTLGEYSSFIQMESDLYVLAYTGTGSDGFISTFKIDSDGVITAVKTHAAGNNVEHTLDNTSHNALVKVDSETIALAYTQIGTGETGNEGFISTFDIGISKPSQVGTISPTSSAVLSWTAPTAGDSDITDYIIQYSTDDSTWSTFDDGTSTDTTATVTGLSDGTTYYFRVAAVNSLGTGSFSSSSSVSVTSSSGSSGGGGNGNCDYNGFGNNNSLRVHQVSYDIDTYQIQVQAYSTCGSISAKITTPTQQSILGLSIDQTLLGDRVAVYSQYLDESDEKFNISIQNKRDSFSETFYIYDKSIIKKYTGTTGYTSQQQGTALSTVTSEQPTVLPETSIVSELTVEITPEIIEEIKDIPTEPIIDEKSITHVEQTTAYTPEPTSSTCDLGTFEKNGVCVMDNDSIKTPQELVSGGLETNFVILVIVLAAVVILAIIILAKRRKKNKES